MGHRQNTVNLVARHDGPTVGRALPAKAQIAMGQHHALGRTGRARGIEQHGNIGQIIGIAVIGRREVHIAKGTADRFGAKPFGMGLGIGRDRRGEKHRCRTGVFHQLGQLARGLARIDRRDDRPHARTGEDAGHARAAVFRHQHDTVTRLDTLGAQQIGYLAAGRIQPGEIPMGANGIRNRKRRGTRGDLRIKVIVPSAVHYLNSAFRFSRKAEMPSLASSPTCARAIASRSRSNWVFSLLS